MQLRCAVITMAPFPKGNVSTVRYTSYLKSLVKEKCYTFVLIYCPTRMAAHINNRFGIYEGIINTQQSLLGGNIIIYLLKDYI